MPRYARRNTSRSRRGTRYSRSNSRTYGRARTTRRGGNYRRGGYTGGISRSYASKIAAAMIPVQRFKYVADIFFQDAIVTPSNPLNHARWAFSSLWEPSPVTNPLANAFGDGNDFQKYLVLNGKMRMEVTNQNKYENIVTAYYMIARGNQSYSVWDVLAQSSPTGLGGNIGDAYASPFDAAQFPTFFRVYKVKTVKIMPGKSHTFTMLNKTLTGGKTIQPTHFLNGGVTVGITQTMLIKVRGGLLVDTDASDAPEHLTLPCWRTGIRSFWDVDYKVLSSVPATISYSHNYDNSLVGFARSVGTNLSDVDAST